MRNPTKATIGVITLGILAGSYQFGLAQAANQNSLVATDTTDPNASSGAAAESETAVSPSAVPTTDSAAGVSTGAAAGNTSGSSNTGGTSASTGAASSSSSSSSNTTSGSSTSSGSSSSGSSSSSSSGSSSTGSSGSSSSGTHTGSAVSYRYGTIQLEVVKSGSTITAINLIQSGTKGREYAQVPGMLVTAAISANGTGFANISGATFTTEAFRSALESALAQF